MLNKCSFTESFYSLTKLNVDKRKFFTRKNKSFTVHNAVHVEYVNFEELSIYSKSGIDTIVRRIPQFANIDIVLKF